MNKWSLFFLLLTVSPLVNAGSLGKRVQDDTVTFQFTDESADRQGLVYSSGFVEDWAQEDDGASIRIEKPVLLTTDSVFKLGKYIPFEVGSDDALCKLLSYQKGGASGDRINNPNMVVATIYQGKVLVGTAAELSRITGTKVYSVMRSLLCE